jgi:hypothetical protein
MQNVRHVFEIVITILKFKITIKFHSKIITNFVLTLILQNMRGWTLALFTARQIGFLVYPEVCSSKLVPTYLPIYTASWPRRRKYHSSRSLKKFYGVLKKEFNALKLI